MPKASRKPRASAKPPRKRARKRSARKDAEADAFTQSLIAHGQAVKPGPGGKLPPGATHEIVEDENGEVKVVRRRFSIL